MCWPYPWLSPTPYMFLFVFAPLKTTLSNYNMHIVDYCITVLVNLSSIYMTYVSFHLFLCVNVLLVINLSCNIWNLYCRTSAEAQESIHVIACGFCPRQKVYIVHISMCTGEVQPLENYILCHLSSNSYPLFLPPVSWIFYEDLGVPLYEISYWAYRTDTKDCTGVLQSSLLGLK